MPKVCVFCEQEVPPLGDSDVYVCKGCNDYKGVVDAEECEECGGWKGENIECDCDEGEKKND